MAGGPEDHFTDSRELYVLVEGDEWAHWRPLIATPVTRPAGLRNSSVVGSAPTPPLRMSHLGQRSGLLALCPIAKHGDGAGVGSEGRGGVGSF